MENYTLKDKRFIESINATMTVYEHNKTGARICTIDNDDSNKVFCIAFRTPPINSTGLTHILEHSVLCGSRKYPVKDPFLELVKGSVNTFLNAFTFPDKTCYPIASQNDKDFKNLMSVYMDAVFYPNIYKKEEIFRQEGWRYEIFDKKDPIVINGVVYNEMKGAFSNPDDVLFRTILNSVFPDTAYQYESGGHPDHIPELTYEQFLNFHRKYYSPSNAYIFLYGNNDKEERLKWLDREYLSKFEHIDFDTSLGFEPSFEKIREVSEEYPIGKDAKPEKKTYYAYSWAFSDNRDVMLNIAIQIINSVLIEDPGAPLKKALLAAGVGDSVDSGFTEGLNQPLETIIVKNSDPDKKSLFVRIIKDELRKAAEGGLDHKAVLSHIDNMEFKLREGKFSYIPKGLEYILSSLNYWLYDDKGYAAGLELLPYFPKLRKALENNVFEKIIKEYLLDNTHASLVTLIPSQTMQEEKEAELKKTLQEYKASLSDSELTDLIRKSEALRAYQATPSTAEEIATLPSLKKEDLTQKPDDYVSELRKENGYDVYFQPGFSNGIGYSGFEFDMTGLPNKYIPYLSLLSYVLGKMRTAKRSENELNNLIISGTGSFGLTAMPLVKTDGSLMLILSLSYSALKEKLSAAESLAEEIISQTDFTDSKHLYELLCAIKSSLIGFAAERGNRLASFRSLSHSEPYGYITDMLAGLGYLDFISDACAHFEQKKDEIADMLKETLALVFARKRFFGYFTGDEDIYGIYIKTSDKFFRALGEGEDFRGKFEYIPDKIKEGIKAPYDVVFVAQAGNYFVHGGSYSGVLLTLGNIVTNDYLWMKIRVKGGAYGCFINFGQEGILALSSYRDPNLKATAEVFRDLPGFIENMKYTESELLKFKIGAIAAFNPVLHVSDRGSVGLARKLAGITYDDILAYQKQLLSATLDQMKDYAEIIEKTLKDSPLCVLGNGRLIEENKDIFDSIRNLSKD